MGKSKSRENRLNECMTDRGLNIRTCTSKVRSVITTPPTVMRIQIESIMFLVWIRLILSVMGERNIALTLSAMVGGFAGVWVAAFAFDTAELLPASADFGFNKNLKGP